MNNITKALAYLLVLFLLLTGAGFMYHKQMPDKTPEPTPNVTPTPDTTPTTDDNGFVVQTQEIYNQALQKYTNDAAVAGTEVAYCNVEGCTNTLDVTFEGFSFNIVINNNNVVRFYVTNGEYQFVYAGESLNLIDIVGKKVSELDPEEVIAVTPTM